MPLQAPRPRPAGAGALRRWELPYADAAPPLNSPRSKLLQRSRIAHHGPPPPPPPGQPANNAVLKSLDAALSLGRESYGDAPISSRGISLPPVEKDRFYGSMDGPQVEQELQRLGALVKGLLRDFAVIKDTVFHLEDDKCSLVERVDHLENSDLGSLSKGLADASKRIQDLIGTVDDLHPRVNVGEAAKDMLDTLTCKFELLDARVMSLESDDRGIIVHSRGTPWSDDGLGDLSRQDHYDSTKVCDDAVNSAVSLACITPANDTTEDFFDNHTRNASASAEKTADGSPKFGEAPQGQNVAGGDGHVGLSGRHQNSDGSARVPPGSRLMTNGTVQSSGHSTPSSASFGNHFTDSRIGPMSVTPFTPVPEERTQSPPAPSDRGSGPKSGL